MKLKRVLFVILCFTGALSALGAEPSTLTVFRNIPYITGGSDRQKLDLYLPQDYETRKEPLPLAILIHGGGFVNGDKETGMVPWTYLFLDNGYAVTTLNYRLSPEAPISEQNKDVKAAVRFLRANAKKYHLNPNKFVAVGSSAGGHHVAFLGVGENLKEFEEGENLDQSSAVQAVVLLWGPTNFLLHRLDRHRNAKVFGNQFDNEEYRKNVSSLFHVTDKTTPTIVVHGDKDDVVPIEQGRIFYEALQKAGVRSEFIILKGGGHASGLAFQLGNPKRILDFVNK